MDLKWCRPGLCLLARYYIKINRMEGFVHLVVPRSDNAPPHLVWYDPSNGGIILRESNTDQLRLELNVSREDQGKQFICKDLKSGLTCKTTGFNVACE